MITNYDKIKSESRQDMAQTLAGIWYASVFLADGLKAPSDHHISEALEGFYDWLGEEADE